MTHGRKWSWIVAAAAVAAAVAVALLAKRRSSIAALEKARESEYRKAGIYAPGSVEFVALPSETPHRAGPAAIGGSLFNDVRIARSTKRTCGACHPPFSGGADDKLHGGFLTRSAQNAAFASCYLHDGRLKDLKDVVEHMITDPELGGIPLAKAVGRLQRDRNLVGRFEANYATGLVASNVVDALVQRMRAAVTRSGAFDRHLSGRKGSMDDGQLRGFEVFKAASCADCHSGPALGGRGVKDGLKIPALRGIARRRLFLHDGSAGELKDALAKMPAAQKLSEKETEDLLRFLRIL